MPDYSFRVDYGRGPPTFLELEFENYGAARAELVIMAGELLRDADGTFWTKGDWRVEMADDQGVILCSLFVVGKEPGAAQAH